MRHIDRNTDYFTERLLAEKEADLIRLAKINEGSLARSQCEAGRGEPEVEGGAA